MSKRIELSIWPPLCDLLFSVMAIAMLLFAIEIVKRKSQRAPMTSVDLIIVVDCTGSQAQSLAALNVASASAIELMALASPGFRVGVIAYRGEVVYERPLTIVLSPHVDGGESQEKALAFLSAIEASSGGANVPLALRRGIELLGAPQPGRRQVLLLLGDVDCIEVAQATEASQSSIEDALVAELAEWADEPASNRRLVSVWSNRESKDNPFFRRLGEETRNGVFCADTARMVWAILIATLAQEHSV